jgi:hypothetical protein
MHLLRHQWIRACRKGREGRAVLPGLFLREVQPLVAGCRRR